MTIANERRGFLKVLCALLGLDFTNWPDVKFVQFFLGEDVDRRPSDESASAVFLEIECEGRDRHSYKASFSKYSLNFRNFLGSSKKETRGCLKLSGEQNSLLRSKFKGTSFEVLATIFTSPDDENNFERALWNRSDASDYVSALRRCDRMTYENIRSALKSKKEVFVQERKVEPTIEGLAALAAMEELRGASVISRPVVRPQPRPRSELPVRSPERRGISAITSAAPHTTQTTPLMSPVVAKPTSNSSTAHTVIQHAMSTNPKHDLSLSPEEVAALVAFWDRHLGKSMLLNDASFQTIFSCYLRIESGCSVKISEGKVVEARMLSVDHSKLATWIGKGCPIS